MEYKKLTDLLEFIVDNRGKTVPTSEAGIKLIATNCILNNRLFPVYEKVRYVSKEIYDTWFRSHPKPGDIIFVNKGTPGKVCMVPEPIDFCIAQDMMAFRVDSSKIYNKYLFAVLRSSTIQNQIANSTVGTLIPHYKKEQLKDLMIPVPDSITQKKIGDIYYNLSYKIELNNQINNNLYEILTTLYKESLNNIKGKEEKTLDEFCNIFTGKKNANEYDEYGKNKFFTCGDKTLKINSYIYNGPAIIISGNGSYTGRTQFYNGKFDLYQRTYACTIKNDVNEDYIYALYTIVKNELVNKISGGTHGSAIPYIVMNDLAKFKIYFDDESLKKLSRQAKIILQKIQLNDEENETISQLRDTLLPKLMNGEIDLDKIEI